MKNIQINHWDWYGISFNPNVTMDFIDKHPEKPWDWCYVSNNPNLTMEFVEKHPDKPWNWGCISDNPNLTMEFVEKHPEKPWNWLICHVIHLDFPRHFVLLNQKN